MFKSQNAENAESDVARDKKRTLPPACARARMRAHARADTRTQQCLTIKEKADCAPLRGALLALSSHRANKQANSLSAFNLRICLMHANAKKCTNAPQSEPSLFSVTRVIHRSPSPAPVQRNLPRSSCLFLHLWRINRRRGPAVPSASTLSTSDVIIYAL